MTDRQLFGVIVRAFGLYFVLLGISAFHGVVQVYGLRTMSRYDWQPAMAFAVFYVIAGVVLVRKPGEIVRFAYDRESSDRTRELSVDDG